MAKFIKLADKEGATAYINIEQICVIGVKGNEVAVKMVNDNEWFEFDTEEQAKEMYDNIIRQIEESNFV